nr:MAG TPA: hypothetical protein [Caudoviricetes sp.]
MIAWAVRHRFPLLPPLKKPERAAGSRKQRRRRKGLRLTTLEKARVLMNGSATAALPLFLDGPETA